ncbi:MAG TPA: 1-acyl-sn-glycerol-3-phosphate acyltransferase [Thermoanaerobaculia bacterium]|nr:1-acyl-sn-glycerol-3-phosphate acyltransferase [Thermoanaerobaculia bacterium]
MTATPARGYAAVRGLTRLLLDLFYERLEVAGLDHVPASGGLIVAANHHNSIVDAMLLIATFDRPLRVLANAPLFKHPVIGPFLRLMGGLPVNRRKEAGADPNKNAALFEATTAALRAGESIALFPEGITQPEPVLQEVKTGTARMFLAAEAAGALDVTLLPVGLVFDEPGTFRTGRAFVQIGKPVDTGGVGSADPAGPIAAARQLTERLREALRAQIVEADDRATLRLLKLAEELWRERAAGPRPAEAARVAWLQNAMRSYRSLQKTDPERVAAFRQALESFDAECSQAGVPAERLSRRYTFGAVAKFVAVEGFSLLVATPLALVGLVLHAVPYHLTALAVRLIPHTDEEEATDKIAAGLLLYPLAWIAEGWAAFALGGGLALLVFLLALPITGFLALAWSERLERVGREARAFFGALGDRSRRERLRGERDALVRELEALADLGEAGSGGTS